MHLLYLDDSGSAGNTNEDYLVLGGVSIFEASANWITQELDKLAQSISPSRENEIEFHASEIFSRRSYPWNGMSKEEAQGVIKAVLHIIADDSYDTTRLFACSIEKVSYADRDLMEMAFEDLCSRFDRYLARLHSDGDRQRGLIILDKSSYETTLQKLANDFRTLGTRWGSIRNLADTPFFVDSRASRLIQLADHVAYAVFRRYNSSDTQYFDIIAPKFDSAGGVLHGLSHKHNSNQPCMCPSCMSRNFAGKSL